MIITAQSTSDPKGTVVRFSYRDLKQADTLSTVGSSALVQEGDVLVTPINLKLIELALKRGGHTLKLKDKTYKKLQNYWNAPHYRPGWRPNAETRHGDLVRLHEPVNFQSGRFVQLAEVWKDRTGQFPVLYGIDRDTHLAWKSDFWRDHAFDVVRRYPDGAEFFENPTRCDGVMVIRVIVMQMDGTDSIPSEQDVANQVQRHLARQSGPVAVHFNRNGSAVAWPLTAVPDLETLTRFTGAQAETTEYPHGVMLTSRQPSDQQQRPCNETLGHFEVLLAREQGAPVPEAGDVYTRRPAIQKTGDALYLYGVHQAESGLTLGTK